MATLALRARHQDPGLALSSQKASHVRSQKLNAFDPEIHRLSAAIGLCMLVLPQCKTFSATYGCFRDIKLSILTPWPHGRCYMKVDT